MKKMKIKNKLHQKRRAKYQLKAKKRKITNKRKLRQRRIELDFVIKRKDFLKDFYKKTRYQGVKTYNIMGTLGLEEDIDNYRKVSSDIIGHDVTDLHLDISSCERIWPSALVMLVSLAEWVSLTGKNCKIRSSDSNCEGVNAYLKHSGFYEYIGRGSENGIENHNYPQEEVVKIYKETSKKNTRQRQSEVYELIKRYATLSDDQKEGFNDIVLSEIFTNVTEHGFVSRMSQGWFVLAQYHKRTGIISICIADNGIGIKNSLSLGKQVKFIEKFLKTSSLEDVEDSKLIKLAVKNTFSGSLESTEMCRSFYTRVKASKGNKRGLGLGRVVAFCEKVNIQLTICSQRGAFSIKKDLTDTSEKCFAGTLYHLVIPANNKYS